MARTSPQSPWIDVDGIALPAFGLKDELPAFEGQSHRHQKHQILYLSSGVLHLELADKLWLLPPQRAAYIPAQTEHRVWSKVPTSLRTVYFAASKIDSWPDSSVVFSVNSLAKEMLIYSSEFGPHSELSHESLARNYFATLAGLAKQWMEQPLPFYLPQARSPAMKVAQNYTLAHLHRPLSLAEVAQEAHVSPRTLTRRFQEETQYTWRRFWAEARLLKAMESLAQSTTSITQIALEVGFESPAAFSRAFEQFTGQAPREYRRLIQGRSPS